jgi:hypothetical protein
MITTLLAEGEFDILKFADWENLVGKNILSVVAIIFVLWMTITRLVETREGMQKLLGPFGRRIAGAYQKRQARYRMDVAQEAKLLAVELLPRVLPADYEDVKGQLHNIIDRVDLLEAENNALRGFVIYDEEWHFKQRLAYAKTGGGMPAGIEDHISWDIFVDQWKTGWRPKSIAAG